MTEQEMKRAGRKAGRLKQSITKLDTGAWKVEVEPLTEEFFINNCEATIYAYATQAGRDTLDFLVTAKQDLPEILEYLYDLEGRVEEMQKVINKQMMWICELQDEIEENC